MPEQALRSRLIRLAAEFPRASVERTAVLDLAAFGPREELSSSEKAWAKKVVKALDGVAGQRRELVRLLASAPASMEPDRMSLRTQDTPGHATYWEAATVLGGFARIAGVAASLTSKV